MVTVGTNKSNGEVALNEFRRQTELIDEIRKTVDDTKGNTVVQLECLRDGLSGIKDGLVHFGNELNATRCASAADSASTDGKVLALIDETRDRFSRLARQVDTVHENFTEHQIGLHGKVVELVKALGGVEERLHEDIREFGHIVLKGLDAHRREVRELRKLLTWVWITTIVVASGVIACLAK